MRPKRNIHLLAQLLIPGILALACLPAGGAEPPCPPSTEPLPRAKPFQPRSKKIKTETTTQEALPTYISADEIRALKGGLSEFIGQVEVVRGKERFTAERLAHDSGSESVDASGAVRLQSEYGDSYETEQLHLDLDTHEGYTGVSQYRLGDNLARGDAARIEFAGRDKTVLHDLRYTTCPTGQDDWFLNVGRLELNRADELGTARHVWVNFQGVPIFYFPYLNFSIAEQRKSGFLFPRLGYEGNHGLTLSVPYYFNLAPNYDATLIPVWLTRRGLMWTGEFRYLLESGDGRIAAESLPDDDLAGRDRAAYAYSHRQWFDPLWNSRVELRYVSDINYLADFGDSIGATSQTHLPQFAEVGFRGSDWNFTTRVAHYQTIDPSILSTDIPYSRLPQLNLSLLPTGETNRTRLHLDGEWVNFDRDVGVTGSRASIAPAVSWPLASSYGFLTPKLGARHVAYELTGAPETSPSFSIATASLDSGLFFDREVRWGDRPVTQTLEPRLFLLHVPHREQDNLPVFDTSLADFSFANLFRENRFSGGDRVGDAEQITAAVTTRFVDQHSGREQLRLSLGQIRYLEDRHVNLPAGTVDQPGSDYAAEAAAWLTNHWYLRSGVQWNEDDRHSDRSSIYAQYQPGRNRIVNLGYRTVRDELAQTDISAEWPLSPYWTVRARSMYSVREDRNVQSYIGAVYATCCWSVRFAATRRYVETRDSLNNVTSAGQISSFHVQLELTGLSRGGGYETPLKEGLFHTWRDPYNPAPAAPLLP